MILVMSIWCLLNKLVNLLLNFEVMPIMNIECDYLKTCLTTVSRIIVFCKYLEVMGNMLKQGLCGEVRFCFTTSSSYYRVMIRYLK